MKRVFSLRTQVAFACATLFFTLLSLRAAAQTTTYKFDFGEAATEPGYVAVSSTTSYSENLGYGWTSTTGLEVRDRAEPGALRRDFVFRNATTSSTFRVSGLAANGKYLMKVLCGDASYNNHVITVSVPGAGTLPTMSPKLYQYLQLSASVNADATGNLYITFGSPSTNWLVNALTLEPTTTSITPVVVSSPLDEWDSTVFATDPTQALLATFGGTTSNFTATGLTRANYLTLMSSEIDFWKTKQNSSGAIIDPYRGVETQYATPAYANAAAALVVYAGRTDLIETAALAMDWASSRLHTGSGADGHNDFFTGMLAHTYRLLTPYVTSTRAATWASNLDFDPYAIYAYLPGSFNWTVVSSCGETLLQLLGLRSSSNPYAMECWAAQGRHFTTPYGLYTEGPMAYDHFPRIWFEDALAQGYTGAYATEAGQAMDRAAITSLFMQSPWGEIPAGGRSGHHQWNEAEQCVTYEIYAAKAKSAGNTLMAGAYKRAAHLAYSSMLRWVRPTGEMQIVKNWVDPSKRFGYESYSYHSQYNLLPMAMLAMAYEYAAPSEDVSESPAPTDTGGFVFQIADTNIHKVFANAGGTYVELETTGDQQHDATGLIRVHRKGISPQLGPSDNLLTGAVYNSPNPSPTTTGIGVSWQDSSSTWHTLGEMGSTNIAAVTVTPILQSPSRVAFDVTYSGTMSGVTTITEHYNVTPGGVQLTTELPGYTGALRYVWPVLSNDGKTTSTISVSGSTVSVSQGGTAQTFTALGSQSVSVGSTDYSNRNGWSRLATAEYPSGGIVTLLIGNPTPSALTSGTLYVDLRATASSGAGTATWVNNGTLGNFVQTGSASLVTNVANTGFPGVLFNGTSDAYTSISNTVADLEGSSDRSIEVWAYNPAISSEESLVSWGRRGTTRTNMSLNFGNNTGYGAVTHFADDLGWGKTVPSAAAWHHLAYVYSGSTDVRVYVDGALANSKTLGGVLATTGSNPINIGAQRSSNGTLMSGVYFSGYINSVRVHGGALSAAQVAANYALGPATTPVNTAPTLSSISDQTLQYNTASSPIALIVSDSDTPLSSLTLSGSAANPALVPTANIVFSGTDSSRTAVITPATNVSGTTAVTLTVSDGLASNSQSFNVTVLNQSQSWQWSNFGADWNNPAIAGDAADPDGDGVSNLLERAFGGNPNASDGQSILPVIDNTGPLLSINYRKAKAATDLTFTVQESPDLQTWTTATGTSTVLPGDSASPVQVIRFTSPAGNAKKKFLRVQVSKP
jgi:hypothetical protein